MAERAHAGHPLHAPFMTDDDSALRKALFRENWGMEVTAASAGALVERALDEVERVLESRSLFREDGRAMELLLESLSQPLPIRGFTTVLGKCHPAAAATI